MRWRSSSQLTWAALAVLLVLGGLLRARHAQLHAAFFGPAFDPHEGYYVSGVAWLETGHFSPDFEGLQPKAWRGPLYPAFIALCEAPFARPSPGHVYAAQAALSTLGISAVAALAFLLGGAPAALFAAAFSALDPASIAATARLNIHLFYGLALLAAAIAAALWARRPAPGLSAALGLSLAGSLLCRSAHFAAPLLLAAPGALRRGESRRMACAVLLWTGVGLLPWTARNYARLGRFVFLDTGAGSYSLLHASKGGLGAAAVERALELAERDRPGFARGGDEGAVESRLLALAWANIAAEPLAYAGGCLARGLKFWRPLWPFLLLAAFAVLRRRDPALDAAACVTASLSAYALIGLEPDYELAAAPTLHALAGCGAAALLGRARGPAAPRPGVAAAPAFAWLGLFLALVAGVQIWCVADSFRGREPVTAALGPRVLSLLDRGELVSGQRRRDPRSAARLRARALRHEGVRLFRLKRLEEAVAVFGEAARVDPSSEIERQNLAVAREELGRRWRAPAPAR